MGEKTRVEVTNKATSLWTIGWLFTLGYTLSTFSETMTFWETILTLFVSYILWPVYLGAQLSGAL